MRVNYPRPVAQYRGDESLACNAPVDVRDRIRSEPPSGLQLAGEDLGEDLSRSGTSGKVHRWWSRLSQGQRVSIVVAIIGAGSTIIAAVAVAGIPILASSSSGSHVAAPPSGPPVKVQFVEQEESSGTLALPKPLILSATQLSTLNKLVRAGADYATWLESKGGLSPGYAVVKLVLTGNRNHRVQIVDMKVIKHCSNPYMGTLFLNDPGGGTIITDQRVYFDLDLPNPNPGNGNLGGNYFNAHTISLSKGRSVTLVIVNYATLACRYVFTISVVDGNRTVTETINDHGRSFKTAGISAGYKALYVGSASPGASAPFRRESALKNSKIGCGLGGKIPGCATG